MIELEEAIARILDAVPAPVVEDVALSDAHLRVVAERIVAKLDLPPFDNSSMDGYAVRAADTQPDGTEAPARLKLTGKIAAGETRAAEVTAGTCVRIFTGSPLPAGSDAVVMQEDTRIEASRPNEVLVTESVRPWENVRFRGEDVKTGTTLCDPGTVLTSARISLLAACGISRVRVGRQPNVGLLATGSELREPGDSLAPGQIYESNRVGLAALVRSAGGIPKTFPLVIDTLDATRAALSEAFSQCDVVVTSAGVSVGELDFVKSAFETMGGRLEFWKVAIKPGRPFVFGVFGVGATTTSASAGKRLRERTPGQSGAERLQFLFGLPGNPVSSFVTFLLLVNPALRRWQGAQGVSLPALPGVLAEPLANPGGRRHFMRVKLDSRGNVRSAGTQASHVLSSLASADGLLDVPPQTTLPAGATVSVLRWE